VCCVLCVVCCVLCVWCCVRAAVAVCAVWGVLSFNKLYLLMN
jgi:hypothetical protein